MTPLFLDIKTKCAAAGSNLTEICALAGVHRSVPERWKTNEPKTRRVVNKLYLALDKRAGVEAGTHTPPTAEPEAE